MPLCLPFWKKGGTLKKLKKKKKRLAYWHLFSKKIGVVRYSRQEGNEGRDLPSFRVKLSPRWHTEGGEPRSGRRQGPYYIAVSSQRSKFIPLFYFSALTPSWFACLTHGGGVQKLPEPVTDVITGQIILNLAENLHMWTRNQLHLWLYPLLLFFLL